uniref:Ig-like domain-containing protein n=1 Tax=Oryzias melastigma TaxID=30732 RepID=A0A3B3CRC5_ORYME
WSLWLQCCSQLQLNYSVHQTPPSLIKSPGQSMTCRHTKDKGHNQMYWFRQRPGEAMTLVAYIAFGGTPDYGGGPQTKFSVVKESIEEGALTVKDLQPDDAGRYFCAVSKHSDARSQRG